MTERQFHTRQLRAIMRKTQQPPWRQLADVSVSGFHPHKNLLAQSSRKSKLVKRGRRSA